MTTPSYHMPIRGSCQALTFDGKNENLLRFFEDITDHANLAKLNDADCIKWTVRYANVQDSETWKFLPTYAIGNNFENFKAEVITLYPGVDSNRKYTIGDLERLIEESRQKGIIGKEALGDYHRNFMRISLFLIGKGRMSTHERNRWYLQGFQPDLREQIAQRLAIVKSDINPDNGYDYMDIHKNAIFILSCSSSDAPHPYTYSTSQPNFAPTSTTLIKPESRDLDIIRQLQAQVTSLTQLIATTNPANHASNSANATTLTSSDHASNHASNHANSVYGNSRSGPAIFSSNTSCCLFCGTPNNDHYLRNCPIVEEYIREGKCVQNPNYRIVLPSGEEIPRGIHGRWIREHLDNFHRIFPGRTIVTTDYPLPTMAAFFEIAPGTEVMKYKVSAGEDPDVMRVVILRRELKKAEKKMEEKMKKAKRLEVSPVILDDSRPPMIPLATKPAYQYGRPSGPAQFFFFDDRLILASGVVEPRDGTLQFSNL
jgi:hypothetical protein